jgi:hypothetical protein
MAPYVKNSDIDFLLQIENFKEKLPLYAGMFGITPAEVASVDVDADWVKYVIPKHAVIPAFAQDWTKLKNQMRYGGDGTIIPPFPTAPDVSVPPSAVTIQPNVEGRFRTLASRIKAHQNYTKAIGEDLMIEAPESTVDYSTYKPVFTLELVAGQVLITWKKLKSDGIFIEKKVDNGSFARLDFDLTPNYLDKSPLPPSGTSQKWTYRLRYFKNEQPIGEFSVEQTITVKEV